MDSHTRSWIEVVREDDKNEAGSSPNDTKFEEHIANGKLTYGGFISILQSLGVAHHSVRGNRYGVPIGKGQYFSVYRHLVSANDYQAMHLSISIPGQDLFQRPILRPNTCVAIKRINVREKAEEIDVSEPGQLYAISREITALLNSKLREHDNIIKLQAIIWEHGHGTGYANGSPLWPSLVMEYCDTTLAEYQLLNPQLIPLHSATLCQKIGDGLDALHSVNIFHGDLKAENVLLKINQSGSPEPKLADFGCSIMFLDKAGKTKYYVSGTEMWCAPECPSWFTTIEQIAATDHYSFGLLMLRMLAEGRNPFEEFGVIPEEWTPKEKLKAIQVMKETDCLYALICGSEGIENLPPPLRLLARMLIADPTERTKASNEFDLNSRELDLSIEYLKSMDIKEPEAALDLDKAMQSLEEARAEEKLLPEPEDPNIPSPTEGEPDIRDPLSFITTFVGKTFVPDCASLSKTKRRAALNPATTARIVEELTSILEDEGIFPTRLRCLECCRLTRLDQDSRRLAPDTLIKEVQHHVQNPLLRHTCHQSFARTLSSSDINISSSLFGVLKSPDIDRKFRATWELFLATATGFGTLKDPCRALQILEHASISGLSTGAYYVQYANYTKQQVNSNLPLRTWLVTSVLFSAGIPSVTFSTLKQFDPLLAEMVAIARSKVYNGSTASFENLRFNSLDPRDNPGCEIIPGFILNDGPHLVQDEMFENTLLHLAAGSHGADVSMITYCIDILGIDIDVRNAGGATPLLLACRAGRTEKILALLSLGASVQLTYECGETPLHWLGLLQNPSRVLDEFLKRGADINAQAHKPKFLPNFIEGSSSFFFAAGPIVWAMAMDNETYVEVLLRNGADLHCLGPSGMSAINIACRPRLSKYLPQLSKEKSFKVTVDDAYKIIASWSHWSEMGMIVNWIEPQKQEETLELVLSCAGLFDSVKHVYDFYRHIVSEAISESRLELLEIVFQGLVRAMGALQNSGRDRSDYIKSPFSHPLWADHYFAREAARRGDTEVLKAVLRMNVDAAAVDPFGWTALHTLSSNSDNPDCVDVLISNGASKVLDLRLPGWGLSAFMNAMANGNFKVADRLLSHTPAAERKELLSTRPARGINGPGLSLVGHFVAWSPYLGCKPLEYLFNLPDIRDNLESVFIADEKNHMTVLMIAAGFDSDGAIYDTEFFATTRRKSSYKFLLTKYAEPHHVNAENEFGCTALHLAGWAGNLNMAELLIETGAGVNAIDKSGRTPLDVLLHPDQPPFLQQDRDAKRLMIDNFERSRKDIYPMLKTRGGVHNSGTRDLDTVTDDIPSRV